MSSIRCFLQETQSYQSQLNASALCLVKGSPQVHFSTEYCYRAYVAGISEREGNGKTSTRSVLDPPTLILTLDLPFYDLPSRLCLAYLTRSVDQLF